MARARNIKPALFKNELLGVADPFLTLLFQSLWTLADKEGRLEDRPLRIKAETFPYRDGLDVNGYLTELQRLGFIVRYTVGEDALIQVVNFKKHQTPHNTEKPSELPPVEAGIVTGGSLQKTSVNYTLSNGENVNALPPDSLLLIPDSLIPDSLIPESNQPKSKTLQPALPVAEKKSGGGLTEQMQKVCRETWQAYADAYFARYGTEPVRNQKTNRNVIDFCKRVSMQEAPDIARWFVSHSDAYYVRQMHAFGLLLKDAEKVRTEWATGQRMTQTKARQTDRTGNTASVVTEIVAERRAVA